MSGRSPSASVVRRLEVPDADVVSCHALSPDEQLLAVCPNSEEIHIFELSGEQEYLRTDILTKHSQRVTGLDWSCHGRLVSASEDRTAFVWERTEDRSWRPVLVELKARRAALCVAWAPNGERFAVGLSSKDAAVCSFEPQVNCWVANKIGRARAAITAVAWHTSSEYLAIGSTDSKCMVYDANASIGSDAEVIEDAGAWVNAIAFSKNNILAFACQDSTVRFKDLPKGPAAVLEIVRWRGLPFLALAFIGRDQLVACGFDYVPVLFQQREGAWQVIGRLDAGSVTRSSISSSASLASKRESFDDARKRFLTAQSSRDSTREDTASSSTSHTNTITSCCVLSGFRFSTSGLDGQVIVWELSE